MVKILDKQNYASTLRDRISLLLLLCMAIVSTYFVLQFYHSAIKNAEQHNHLTAKTLSADINNALIKQLIDFQNFSRIEMIHDLPNELAYTQGAIKLMQSLVETSHLQATLVADSSGEIQEVYPVSGYHFSDEFYSLAEQLREDTDIDSKALVAIASDQARLQDFFDTPYKDSYLIQALPLFTDADSLTDPFVFSGITVGIVSIQQMLDSILTKVELKQGTYLQLVEKDAIIYDSRWLPGADVNAQSDSNTSYINSAVTVTSPVASERALMQLRLFEPEYHYTATVLSTIQQIVIVIIILMLIVLWILNHQLRSFNKPIQQLLQMCRDITEANYNISSRGQRFHEFETIETALLTLAQKVEVQIESLIEAKEAAEQGERTKAQFVANMSHEIRTPMNGILGFIQILESSELTEEQTTHINSLKKTSVHLLGILDDILDLSKLEADKIEIIDEVISVPEIMKNISEIFRPGCDEKGIEFHLEIQDSVPDNLLGDELRIRQIVANLVSNAIKFTHQGSVTLTVAYDLQSSFLNITVIDTGVGIDPAYQKEIFKPFSQEDAQIARKYGGTGLGMNIAQQLLQLMNGEIRLASELGKGSSFSISIPAKITSSADLKAADAIDLNKRISFADKHILIAEDNITNQMVIKAFLKPSQITITFANNGQEAVEKAQQMVFDLILMDVQMPVLDGLSATRQLREDVHYKGPIIGVSANALQDDVDRALASGMDDYLAKPIIKDALYKTIRKWLNIKKAANSES